MTLLDGSSSCDAPMDDSTDDSEEELDEDEDIDVYEIVVEDGKGSEAERVEGVGESSNYYVNRMSNLPAILAFCYSQKEQNCLGLA